MLRFGENKAEIFKRYITDSTFNFCCVVRYENTLFWVSVR